MPWIWRGTITAGWDLHYTGHSGTGSGVANASSGKQSRCRRAVEKQLSGWMKEASTSRQKDISPTESQLYDFREYWPWTLNFHLLVCFWSFLTVTRQLGGLFRIQARCLSYFRTAVYAKPWGEKKTAPKKDGLCFIVSAVVSPSWQRRYGTEAYILSNRKPKLSAKEGTNAWYSPTDTLPVTYLLQLGPTGYSLSSLNNTIILWIHQVLISLLNQAFPDLIIPGNIIWIYPEVCCNNLPGIS